MNLGISKYMELQLKKNLSDFKITQIHLNLYLYLFIFILTVTITSNISFAEKIIYSCKDKNGNTVFTDTPENDSNCINPQEKKLPPIKIAPSVKKSQPDNQTKSTKPTNTNEDTKYSISFIQPTNGTAINHCGGILDVSYNLEPDLIAGDTMEIYLNGAKYTDTSSTSFNIPNLDRGNHSIEVKITRDGKTISSQNVGFQFLRNCTPRATPRN